MFVKKIDINQIEKLDLKSVFNSISWLKIYPKEKLILLGIFNKNEEIIGCFYYYKHTRAKFLTHLAAPLFSPHCGFYVKDPTSNPANKNTFKKKVFEAIIEFLDEQKYDLLSLSFPLENIDFQEFIWRKFTIEPKYTYCLNLDKTEEEITNNMSSERRKNIRKAEKDGITIKRISNGMEDWKSLKKLIEGTLEKQKVKYNKDILNALLNDFSTEENSFAFLALDKENNPIACNFCVYDSEKSYYLFGGYDQELKHEGAGALAHWSAIKFAKEKGIKVFDFEGSMLKPVEKYFRGFGAEITPYFVVNKSKFKGKSLMAIKQILG